VAAAADAIAPQYRASVLIGHWCGLRWGELGELRRKDISDNAEIITVARGFDHEGGCHISTTKSGKERRVHVPPHIRASRSTLLNAALDAIIAGRDYHTDKTVMRALLDFTLADQNIGNAARERADTDIARTLVEASDEILTDMAAALQPHSAALTAAAAAGLPADLDDVAAIKQAGNQAMACWAGAQDAVRVWTAAVKGFQQMAAAARITVPDKRLILTADDPADLPNDPWLLCRSGVALGLPTSLAEYVDRVAAQQRRAAASECESVPV
jgi:hypothetical protein